MQSEGLLGPNFQIFLATLVCNEGRANMFFIKRFLDIIFSIVGIFLTGGLLLLIAILVKLTSEGPIIFKQGRLGKDGKPFNIYKFRTMVVNAESIGSGLFNLENDPRVTKLGSFLRKTSLDELPQFFNILKGDMSFVGPRPPVTYELGDFDELSLQFKKRFEVKPGVTGLAQVSGRNDLTWDEKIVHDLVYLEKFKKYGVLFDFKILFLTFFKVLKMEGSFETEKNIKHDQVRIKKQR